MSLLDALSAEASKFDISGFYAGFLFAMLAVVAALLVAVVVFFDGESRTWHELNAEGGVQRWRVWFGMLTFEVSLASLTGTLFLLFYIAFRVMKFENWQELFVLLIVGGGVFLIAAFVLIFARAARALPDNRILNSFGKAFMVWLACMGVAASPIIVLVCVLRIPGAMPGY